MGKIGVGQFKLWIGYGSKMEPQFLFYDRIQNIHTRGKGPLSFFVGGGHNV